MPELSRFYNIVIKMFFQILANTTNPISMLFIMSTKPLSASTVSYWRAACQCDN
jgi:hypothetical protein